MSKKDRSKITLVFNLAGKRYKFFWINFSPTDKSLYFNFYPFENEKKEIAHTIITADNPAKSLDEVIKRTQKTPFDSQKYSYHPTGLFQVKSKKNEPLEKGLYFVPFSKIDEGVQFASLLPSFPSSYPLLDEEQPKGNQIMIEVLKPLNNSLAIYLYLLKKEVDLPPSSLSNYRDIECSSPNFPFRILFRVSPTSIPWKNEQIIVTTSLNKL
jgi:hypothetical protein